LIYELKLRIRLEKKLNVKLKEIDRKEGKHGNN